MSLEKETTPTPGNGSLNTVQISPEKGLNIIESIVSHSKIKSLKFGRFPASGKRLEPSPAGAGNPSSQTPSFLLPNRLL